MSTEPSRPVFPYHYGFEADSYSFYRIPKVLFTEEEFRQLSTDAKLLYGLLLDRMQLSIRNSWMDEEGKVFIYFTVESIMEALACGNKKAGRLLAELDDRRGIGLITRIRQGMGKPDRIYVRKCITQDMSKRHVLKCQNDISGDVKTTCQDMSKGHGNKININNTEKKETDHITSRPVPDEDGLSSYEQEDIRSDPMDMGEYIRFFEDSLSISELKDSFPHQADRLTEIVHILSDTCSSKREWIRISGEERPAEAVRAQLMSLNSSHIQYVIESMNGTTTKVRNIRQYMLAALYNAPLTINSYYDALVRHDMYADGGR